MFHDGFRPQTKSFGSTLAALLAALAFGTGAPAAELVLDFTAMPPGPLPEYLRPALTGEGPPPEWRLIQVDAPSSLPPLSDRPEFTRQTVLAQLSEDGTDERFPLLIHERDVFADFTAILKFRTVSGRVERMAGLAFRLQDPTNYYVIRASSLGNTLRFYKFVNGVRSNPIGPEIPIPSGEWHTLEVTCRGNTIRCRLNDREVMPELQDSSFTRGRLALWTKSDSVSHFASLTVRYDPVVTLPERLVRKAMERYPRLHEVTVYALREGRVTAVASSNPDEVGREAEVAAGSALSDGQIYAGTTREHAAAVFPLRDRNGDPMFALKLKMRTFAGQTRNNVAARGKIVADYLEEMVRAVDPDAP